MTKKAVQEFQNKILSWWQSNKRDLPWRHTHNPYYILVSEVMLQQTQVSRVIPKYLEFVDKFPTVQSLGASSAAEVITTWKGLGYNRRALYLHRLAISLKDDPFPTHETDLLKLPGIGLYTARAIQIFAFKNPVAAVDTNIRQILEIEFFSGARQNPKTIQALADQLIPQGRVWEWHQALMDYGALALIKPKKVAKPSIKFTDTNRFLRGRMIDLLRTGPQPKIYFLNFYSKSPQQITSCLVSLERDGLIKLIDGVYSLA